MRVHKYADVFNRPRSRKINNLPRTRISNGTLVQDLLVIDEKV